MASKKWLVYIIECQNGNYYTGITCDLKRRFKQHAEGKGARYTRSFGVKKIVYTEPCKEQSAAIKREREIKKMPRKKKILLWK